MTVRFGVFAACAAAACCTVASAGPDWLERGDAGSTIGTAQVPTRPAGATSLLSLSGDLAAGLDGPDFEDLYYIRVTDPMGFSMRPVTADFDAVLYLFNITINGEGYGLLANDNESLSSNLPKLVSASNDGSGAIMVFPGDYVVAITGRGRVPVSRTGDIFHFESSTEVSGADGPGGINPLDHWEGAGETGHYSFTFTATDFPRTPAPGSLLAPGGGALVITRRRR